MQFKIDTKPSYTLITPMPDGLNANLTALLRQKCTELTESGSQNFIVDLHKCTNADIASLRILTELHEECYSGNQSIVFTGITDNVMNLLKQNESDNLLNIAPTMQEAIDIVSMEILERDLFDEE